MQKHAEEEETIPNPSELIPRFVKLSVLFLVLQKQTLIQGFNARSLEVLNQEKPVGEWEIGKAKGSQAIKGV